MKVKIYPSDVKGCVQVPASKSLGHRALICAALSQGESNIYNLDISEDLQATIDVLKSLGAMINLEKDHIRVDGTHFLNWNHEVLNCNESGSTLRFIIPLASLLNQNITLSGTKRLLERPQSVYQEIFDRQELFFNHQHDRIDIKGPLRPGEYHVKGNISSQFISGLLFVLPLLNGDSKIIVEEPFESKSYVNLTLSMLKTFNIHIKQSNNVFHIAGNQHYQATDYTVEGDYSQLAFFGVLAAINAPLRIEGVSHESVQGDRIIIEYLDQIGADITHIKNGYIIKPNLIKSSVIDIKDCPDLGPILSVLGMFSDDYIKIINAGRLRIKESDRIEAMSHQLKMMNADVSSTTDTLKVNKVTQFPRRQVEVSGCNDHRIVMACSIAATVMEVPVIIDGAEAIDKSYPKFFNDLKDLGVRMKVFQK